VTALVRPGAPVGLIIIMEEILEGAFNFQFDIQKFKN
jgi:hypothetical protein